MPQIEFDDQGEPIPSMALPPFGSDSDLPPTVLTFTESADFSVADYRALGFTHFEAWCVGAAGGRGGDATSQIVYATEMVMRPVSQSVWNLVLEQASVDDFWRQTDDYNIEPDPARWPTPLFNRVYKIGKPGSGSSTPPNWYTDVTQILPGFMGWVRVVEMEFDFYPDNVMPSAYWLSRGVTGITYTQALELSNPNHLMPFVTYRQVALDPMYMEGMGGGGGGGGLHKVAGALADLSDIVPVVVGKAGVDAGFGQVHQNGVWIPDPGLPSSNPLPTGVRSTPVDRDNDLRYTKVATYLHNYLTSYPLPHASFANPQSGEAGEASSFAGAIGQASGGEGGTPGMIWDGAKFIIKGDGGSGGIGNRILPGGGAIGSVAEGVNGNDGVWLSETGIGSGGGGGKGGRASTVTGSSGQGTEIATKHLATAGGRGSFSYGDTSVYGQRQFRQPWTYLLPNGGSLGFGGVFTGSGIFTFVPVVDSNNLVTPGGGGGARPSSNLKYGSRATGFSPDGVVVLRLTKIT